MINEIKIIPSRGDMIYREIRDRRIRLTWATYVEDLLARVNERDLFAFRRSVPEYIMPYAKFYLFGRFQPCRSSWLDGVAEADAVAAEVVLQFIAAMTREYDWCYDVHDVTESFLSCLTEGSVSPEYCECEGFPCFMAPDGLPCHTDKSYHESCCAWSEPSRDA